MGFYGGRRDKRNARPKTATELQKDIDALDFRLETEALKFSEEKKIRGTIRDLKKQKASYLERVKLAVSKRISESSNNNNSRLVGGRISRQAPEEVISKDFSEKLKSSRLVKGQTQEEFAAFLNERESIVSKWENGSMKPSIATAKKLEKILKITLVVEAGVDAADASDIIKSLNPAKGNKTATLGDLVKVKVRKR